MSIVQIIATALLLAGGAGMLWQKLRGGVQPVKLNPESIPVLLSPDPARAVRSSDKSAPAGVQEYLKLVSLTAPSANEKIWWGYALAELTECQVLRAEVSRLAPKVQPAEPAKPEVKV